MHTLGASKWTHVIHNVGFGIHTLNESVLLVQGLQKGGSLDHKWRTLTNIGCKWWDKHVVIPYKASIGRERKKNTQSNGGNSKKSHHCDFLRGIHLKLHNIDHVNVDAFFVFQNPRKWIKSHSLLPCFPPIYHKFLTSKKITKAFTPHTCMHYVVIIVISVIIVMLTLYNSTVSHTLILFYHASMFKLHNSLISRAFRLPQARHYKVQSVFIVGWGSI